MSPSARSPTGAAAARDGGPELILHGGKIVTVDQQFQIAQAVAVDDGRFVAVGDDATVLALAGPATRCASLEGRTVIPGLIDVHFRLLDRATAQFYGADVSLLETVADMLDAVRDAATRVPVGQVITSNAGWYPSMLREQRAPTRAELDAAAPRHPVVLRGDFLYLNSMALRRFGIDAGTGQPDFGWIEKAPATGEPTGILMGDAALLTGGEHSRFTDAERDDSLRRALHACAAAGLTSIREGGVSRPDLRRYQALHRAGELPIRVSLQLALDTSPPIDEILDRLQDGPRSNPIGDNQLRIDRVAYLFADDEYHRMGVTVPIQNQRVPEDRVHRYFQDRCCSIEKIEQIVTGMAQLGLSGGILAAGDRIIGEVLNALERANDVAGLTDRRWVLSQVPYVKSQHYERIRDLGLVLTPMWHHYYYYPHLVHHHGYEFAQTSDPFRSLREAGVRMGLGSDLSKIPLNYFVAFYFLHSRCTWKWGAVNPAEALSREEAIRAMTIDNAFVTFEEDVKGSIETGKLADLVLLSDDLLTVPIDELPRIRPLLTMVGGRIAYRDAAAPREIVPGPEDVGSRRPPAPWPAVDFGPRVADGRQ